MGCNINPSPQRRYCKDFRHLALRNAPSGGNGEFATVVFNDITHTATLTRLLTNTMARCRSDLGHKSAKPARMLCVISSLNLVDAGGVVTLVVAGPGSTSASTAKSGSKSKHRGACWRHLTRNACRPSRDSACRNVARATSAGASGHTSLAISCSLRSPVSIGSSRRVSSSRVIDS